MSFTVDDETAFRRAQEELGREFATWIEKHGVNAEPGDAELLLNWKWAYADGELGRWAVPDLAEFLLQWCPRKLSCPLDECAEIPRSVAAFMDFLAHQGLLAPGSQPPSALRRYCEKIGPRFQHEMSNPANFGLAKSALGGMGNLPADVEETELLARLQELTGTDPDELFGLLSGEDDEPSVIGPVRLPSPADHLQSLRTAPTFQQVRGLAQRCLAPGLAVTARGNLRLADARRLVAELNTGDEADPPEGILQSTAELPTLAWVVELAVAAGAVDRTGDLLVARPEFAELADPEAFRRVARAAFELGLSTPAGGHEDGPRRELLVESAPQLLAELLEADVDGEASVAVDELAGIVLDLAELSGSPFESADLQVRQQVERLVGLGLIRDAHPEDADDPEPAFVTLTPAGVTTAAELVPELLGIDVVLRPDPATADARAIVDPLLLLEHDEAEADVREWFAVQPDPATAAAALLAEITSDARPAVEVLVGLEIAGLVLDEHADAAALDRRDGVHAPLVLTWLLTRGALDPADADPGELMFGMVTVAATMMDVSGPEGALEFVRGADREQVLELLDQIWRLDHPRLAEVLEAIGKHHPDKKVAKAARKCLVRYRSRLSQ